MVAWRSGLKGNSQRLPSCGFDISVCDHSFLGNGAGWSSWLVWFWFGLVVMGGPDSNRDLCKIGDWAYIGCAGYYYAFGQCRQIRDVLRKFSFVEMSEWVGALEKKGEGDTWEEEGRGV